MPASNVTFVTATTYGSWLPGDARGYVQSGQTLPSSPTLERHARLLLREVPVAFSAQEQSLLFSALADACVEFDYRLFDLSIESWHLHWIVQHQDSVTSMVARLKNRMRQKLNRGRIWTKGFCHRAIRTEGELLIARNYIRRHPGCRLIDGKIAIDRPTTPPQDSASRQ
jgi:hypothetical protein